MHGKIKLNFTNFILDDFWNASSKSVGHVTCFINFDWSDLFSDS